MSERRRLCRRERYEACDDEVVSKCALPGEKGSAPVSQSAPRNQFRFAIPHK